MKYKYPYLQNKDFLLDVDNMLMKNQYVKITLLDFNEHPIEDIQGKVISGNLSIDGSSSLRRTGNLSILLDGENKITINKKIDLQVGFKNTLQNEYPIYSSYKIIWFPLGTYVVTSISANHSNTGTEISMQIKDKMCLLNGEVSGTLTSTIEFHQYETLTPDGNWIIEKPTIYQIIQELVNHIGQEQLNNIIINDVDSRNKQVMKWIGSSPLYIKEDRSSDGTVQYTATTIEDEVYGSNYTTYEYGRDVGYIYTDFTYPGELIGDAGKTICDMLDTIKNTLGNYEYYYDVDGNFIFHEIKNYLNTTKAKTEIDRISNSDYIINIDNGKSVYEFNNAKLITSYSSNPRFEQIKNDFVVWGIRKNAEGATFPIRYHLSIDKKPVVGNSYKVFFYEDPEDHIIKAKCPQIYQSKENFPQVGAASTYYYSSKDGCVYMWDGAEKQYKVISNTIDTIKTKDWRTELYLQGAAADPYAINSNYYYTELLNEWPKIYDIKNGKFYESSLDNVSDLDYFLDFIDTGTSVGNLSIGNIGRRTKVVNDSKINCIFEPEIPNLVLINKDSATASEDRLECELKDQDYIQLSQGVYSLLTSGGVLNSAYIMIKELLDQYTKFNETISISSIPIYYLEPNTRITVRDESSGIFGDYMINSISLPFDTSGLMTLSCTKAMEKY